MSETHRPDCRWQRTTRAECEYRETHHYCPHFEHACNCRDLRAATPSETTRGETEGRGLLPFDASEPLDGSPQHLRQIAREVEIAIERARGKYSYNTPSFRDEDVTALRALAARVAAPAGEPSDTALLDFIRPGMSFDYEDEEGSERIELVLEHGGMNDREWTTIGVGDDVRAALRAALSSTERTEVGR